MIFTQLVPIAQCLSLCSTEIFFYLSGVDQEESILLLFPHALMSIKILFLKEHDITMVWEGEKLTKERAPGSFWN
jgi:hypothetical protein